MGETVGEMCALGHLPWKTLSKWAKMGQKATPSKSGFQHLTSMSTILEVYW